MVKYIDPFISLSIALLLIFPVDVVPFAVLIETILFVFRMCLLFLVFLSCIVVAYPVILKKTTRKGSGYTVFRDQVHVEGKPIVIK